MKKEEIAIADFLKLDIRVGEVKECIKVEQSNKLLKLTVDFGPEIKTLTIFTGLAKLYTPEQLVGNKYLFLTNLPPKKMLDQISQGMILVANVNDVPTLFPVDQNLPNGSNLY